MKKVFLEQRHWGNKIIDWGNCQSPWFFNIGFIRSKFMTAKIPIKQELLAKKEKR